ncbi:MAG: hydroxymethylbilane synthase [Candidatus Omnitrophica bacterium]|nr:hydroxymethylbilane synthase [Candidatus Omnitrophota bacterium]
MKSIVRIGIRPGALARKQLEEVIVLLKRRYPNAAFCTHTIATTGDRDKTTPLSRVTEQDFFTRDIDQALLAKKIDVAVHSSKDLPDVLPPGLVIAFETKSISLYDCLVSRGNLKLAQLPVQAKIGASSQRRKEQLLAMRHDIEVVDVRGTIEERLALIDKGIIDALLVAHAALLRLGLEYRIAEIFPLETFETHPKQGSLSVVVREGA